MKATGSPARPPASGRAAGAWCAFRALAEILLWLALFPAPGQASLPPNIPLNKLLHKSWRTGQGLPQNSVLAIAQTPDGYLWLGTEEGLARFDGVRFKVFDQHTPGLLNNTINALLADRQGNLWIGTDGGGLSRLSHGKFTAYTSRNGLPSDSVLALYEDKAGTLWIGTDGGGLARFANGHFQTLTKANGLPDNTVCSISGDGHGNVWIGTHAGIAKFSDGVLQSPDIGVLKNAYVRAVYAEQRGVLWAGTSNGLWRIAAGSVRKFTTADGLTSDTIFRLYEDRAGTLWIGTGAGGLNRYANGSFSSFTESDGLLGKDVWSILEDREGTLWIGTAGGGLNCLKAGSFQVLTHEDGLASNVALGIYQDREGAFWIGSDQGLTRWQDGRATVYTTKNGLPDNLVFSITEDDSGSLWVGTRHGIARLQDGEFKAFKGNGAPADYVMCSYTDSRGRVWFGTRAGLTVFDGTRFRTYTTRDGLSNNFVLAIDGDRQGNLWIGTEAGGLNRFRNGKFSSYTMRNGLASNVVWAIYAEPDGTLWLGTNGGGLSRFRNGKFTNYTSANGLPDDGIFSVVDDGGGHLWMSSNKGVFEVSKRQLNAFAEGAVTAITPRTFGVEDGMKTPECNGGFQPDAWRGSGGKIYFATNDGVAIVDPKHLVEYRSFPRVLLERVLVNNKAVDFDHSPLVLPPGRAQFEFRFTAPTFLAPDKIQFSYKLQGFDKDWIAAGERRVAYYTNIPHGEYRFLVRDGIDRRWSSQAAELPIVVKPHFWETGLFYLLSVLTGILFCAALYRMRMRQATIRERKLRKQVNERTAALQESERQLRRSRDELELRVRERTEELSLAKEAAEKANRAKSDFLANMSHEVRTPIHGILGMTEIALATELTSDQREYLDMVKESTDSLLTIMNDILDFSKIEARKLTLERAPFRLRKELQELTLPIALRAQKKGIALETQINPCMPEEVVGDPLRLRQVLLNLLDNAVKFTAEGGLITLTAVADEITEAEALVHFAVADTGIGIPAEKRQSIFEAFSQADTSSTRRFGGTGLGLTISHQLAQMMGGKLWVESEPGSGSTFHLTTRLDLAAAGQPVANEPQLAGPVPA